jgi:hypothetical protein
VKNIIRLYCKKGNKQNKRIGDNKTFYKNPVGSFLQNCIKKPTKKIKFKNSFYIKCPVVGPMNQGEYVKVASQFCN